MQWTTGDSGVLMCFFLILAYSCMLSQGLPLIGRHNQLSPENNILERQERDIDNSCILDNDKTVFVGNSIGQLVENEPSLIDSVDICLVVSGTATMPFSEKWIQFLSNSLNKQFVAAGVGSQTGNGNRFCVIQFGGRSEDIRARIITVNGDVFFDAETVSKTRADLKRNGHVADGYEAIEFAINNIPFRNSLNVAKGIILVTDTGRSVLADRVNLTKPTVSYLLQKSNISLDIISNISVQSESTESNHILGMLDYHTKVVYQNGVTHTDDHEQIKIVSSHGDTLTSYAELAFHTGGGAWLLGSLYGDIKNPLYRNYIKGIAIEYVNSRSYLKSNVCEICSCAKKEGNVSLLCTRPSNQRNCLHKLLATGSIKGNPLQIFATVAQQQGGDNVNISFHGNSGDMVYECILIDSTISDCVSPVIMTGLATGTYEFLIIGQTSDRMLLTSETIHFTVAPNSKSRLSINITEQTASDNSDYVHVSFQTTPSYVGSHVTVTCQIDNEEYQQCTSPFSVKRSNGWHRSLTLIATDEFGDLGAIQETVYFPGENKFTLAKGSIDSDGTLQILLYSSNIPDSCYCYYKGHADQMIECTPQSNGKPFEIFSDPKTHGNGVHNLKAFCIYKSVIHYESIEFNLRSIKAVNIKCSLDVNGPFTNDTIIAQFNCDTPAISTSCMIDSLPSNDCSNGDTFNTSSLLPGYHLFTLTAFDSVSEATHVTIQPFYINTSSDCHCCPKIIKNDSKIIDNDNTQSVTVNMATTIGNCTAREEFSYSIKWGDGASSSGVTAGHVTPLIFSRTSPSAAGQYTAILEYCTHNSKSLRCCDTLMLPWATS